MAVSIKTVQRSPRSQGCSSRRASGPKSPMGMPMRGLLLDEGARAGGADLVHLEVGDLAALQGDILRVLPADFKDGVGPGHPEARGRSR